MRFQGQAAVPRHDLPPEIAFLTCFGISREALALAAELAEQADVSADVALLAEGIVSEDFFYRALADAVDVPFLVEFALQDADPPRTLETGRAILAHPLGPIRLAIVPRGEAIARLLELRGRLPESIGVTAPARLREAALAAARDTVSAASSHELADTSARRTARDGASRGQILALPTTGLLLAIAAFLAPIDILGELLLLLALPFFAIVVLRLAAARADIGTDPPWELPAAPDDALPVYSVIVPLYREEAVLPRLVAALERIDYPRAKLDIMLVVEEDDLRLREALRRTSLPGCFSVIVAPPGEPRTKPRALNVALPLARGEYTVVYDAEDVPDPGQLRLAVATLERSDPGVACLQARLVIDNTEDSLLATFFTIEYATLFDVINPALAEIDWPIPLGGTSNHFRTAVLRELGGWDAWNVTEDAELGIRLALHGYRVADLPSATYEEAPASLRPWMLQRTRWMKGFLQTIITHSQAPAEALARLGPGRFFGAVTLTAGTTAAALGFPIFTVAASVELASGGMTGASTFREAIWTGFGLVLFLAGIPGILLPCFAGISRRGLRHLAPFVLLMPFYYVLVSIAAWRGLFELFSRRFHWHKTPHGLARTSRAGLLRSGAQGLAPLPRAAG